MSMALIQHSDLSGDFPQHANAIATGEGSRHRQGKLWSNLNEICELLRIPATNQFDDEEFEDALEDEEFDIEDLDLEDLDIEEEDDDGEDMVKEIIAHGRLNDDELHVVEEEVDAALPDLLTNRQTLQALDEAIDKVDNALPAVRGLEATDTEMDELAGLATGSYKDLMDLGMQVDSRFASEIFSVASNMLGHAITAKTAKMDKKLKMIDLQLKKMRLDQQQAVIDAKAADAGSPEAMQTAQGMVLSRNDLLDRLLASKDQKDKKE
jgi:hypothetical protein